MASLVARTAQTSPSRSIAAGRICRRIRESLSYSVWLCKSYCRMSLGGHIPPSPKPSSSADPLLATPLSGKFPPAVPKTGGIGSERPAYGWNSYSLRKWEGLRGYRTPCEVSFPNLEPEVSRSVVNQGVRPDGNLIRASRKVVRESSHDLPRQRFTCEKELPVHWGYGLGKTDLLTASTTSEAIATLRHRQQQGLHIDTGTFIEILKWCKKEKDLMAARKLHECIIRSRKDKNQYVMNTLLNVYSRCGTLEDARSVFNGLEKKDDVTWRIMIAGYADNDHVEGAMEVFNRMRQGSLQPNEVTCLTVLKACASPVALKWGKELHAYVRQAGLESDVRVGTALIQMYAKCGSIAEARGLFEELTNRNLITWNVMIGAYAKIGMGLEAYKLFLQMKREGFKRNAITYLSILNASASAGALERVKEVHMHALKEGLDLDLRVSNALVHMYAKSGSIDDARQVFTKMKKRDIITWNTMIGAFAENGSGGEAYQLFLQLKREGFRPNTITYTNILNPSASTGALEWVKEVHCDVLSAGLESDLRVGTALVHMYAKSGSIDDARLVFDRMEKHQIITWNVMIGAYAEIGHGLEAYRLFLRMQREGFKPDAISYLSILNLSACAGALDWVKEVHSHACRAGLTSDLRVGKALVHMYAKSGSINDARLVFNSMEERDLITWNMMIGAYAESGCGPEAYQLFLQMERQGFNPDAVTFLSILNASASVGALEWVKEVHGHASREGLDLDLRVANALVHMYAKCGSMNEARLLFNGMEERDVITWNTMIGAYAESGRGVEAYHLFLRMKREGFRPDAVTYMSIMNPSSSVGALEWVREVHGDVRRAGLELDARVGACLVHMYAKCGSIDDARRIFHRLQKRDVVTWNTMLGGLAQHGCGHEALELFKSMSADSVKPDESTFVAVLSACCHAGLLDDGRRLLLAMKQDFGIEPTVMHYTCMVDLLGRAGHLEEAKRLIGDMPVEPDGVIWKSLLGACRTYGNVELGELAAQEVLKLEPKDASAYVLLSNIYAAACKWEKVSLVRRMMQERGVRKEPGCSWIEVDNKIHEFVVGDISHPEAKAIHTELSKLTENLKAVGYIPTTQLGLRNLYEDKELALCSHSEKLAITYGLMHTPLDKPIRVYKNLRVCLDCHTATRLISKVTGREIIARDGNRFHHFKDGVCSCGDYW